MQNVVHQDISVNGLTLHVVTAGPPEGPMVLLLHGFPEFWYSWRKQIPALAEAGLFVVCPDQRGYNTSSKPADVAAYSIDRTAEDAVALIDHFGRKTAAVVGHDWGGVVAWWLALQHHERVSRFAALNMAHPLVFERALRTWKQARRSWYIAMFQLPWLPEWWLSKNEFQKTIAALYVHSRRGAFTDEDLVLYRRAFAQPGAIRAMLAWYRAAARVPRSRIREPRVRIPTLLLWGVRDSAVGWEMAQPSADFCDDVRLVPIEEAHHFVQADAPERVNIELLAFLSAMEDELPPPVEG